MATPNDTHPDAERVQVRLFRRATVSQRLRPVRQTSAAVIRMSKAAIARAHPEWSARQVDVAFVELHYGRDLAIRVAERLGIPW